MKQTLLMIPKHEALDIVDLWARENRFGSHLPVEPQATKSRFTQTEQEKSQNVGTVTDITRLIA